MRRTRQDNDAPGSVIAADIGVLLIFCAGLFHALAVVWPQLSAPAGPWLAGGLAATLGAGMYLSPALTLLITPFVYSARLRPQVLRWWGLAWVAVLLTTLLAGLIGRGGALGNGAAAHGGSYMGGFYAVVVVILALIAVVAIGGRSVVRPAVWLARTIGGWLGAGAIRVRESVEERAAAAAEARAEAEAEAGAETAPKRGRATKPEAGARGPRVRGAKGAASKADAAMEAAREARRRAVLEAELEAADAPDGDSPLERGALAGNAGAADDPSATADIGSKRRRAPKAVVALVDEIGDETEFAEAIGAAVGSELLPAALEQAVAAETVVAEGLTEGVSDDAAVAPLSRDASHVQLPDNGALGGDEAGPRAGGSSQRGSGDALARPGELGSPQRRTSEALAELEGQLGLFPSTQTGYELPPLTLLRESPPGQPEEHHLERRARTIERTLGSFNVEAKCINAVVGPRVTRYELKIGPGINVNKIHGLADNLALELAVKAVRIQAPVPGMSAVGIEVPNASPQLVTLRDILESAPSQSANHPLTVGLGRDIAGHAVVANLAKMPHLLVAGATGSGKSVCLNALIVSLLARNAPDTLRLILIDPKRVEMTNYSDVPHLACPVVHDVTQAQSALKWVVAEMDRRYRLLEQVRARNIAAYNQMCETRQHPPAGGSVGATNAAGEPLAPPEGGNTAGGNAAASYGHAPMQPLPFIVVIVDELADLMMLAGQTIEKLICRIAQLSRAVGIHLVVATQRPDVKVITGTIKANIPSRIAFAVVSQIDSRTILDGGGADKLLGSGDMLFAPIGENVALRVQGCFLADDEIDRVVEHCKAQAEAHYDDSITRFELEDGGPDAAGDDDDGDYDPLWRQAADIVQESGRASTSYLQRRLKVGYNRAARIMEELEDAGVVSGPDAQGNRKVLE